jgi:hypothetical protein
VARFAADVRTGRFPTAEEGYGGPARPAGETVEKLYG